ncbi:MAG TPA: sulfatase [Phycisphaerae bacterium]|nr:sulfatase [Phycisphaerae bacterium]
MARIGVVCVVALQAWAAEKAPQGRRPNILFIFSDDHTSQAIGAYGSKFGRTPHIDRLAQGGMRFQHCLVTNSICGPSRAVVLTGKYSHLNGIRDNGSLFDGSQQTFPKLLQKAGYQTAIVGKWHLGTDPTGFDYWEVLPGQGEYYNPVFLTAGGKVNYTGYVTDVIADRTLEWLKNRRDPDKPFMLMCQHKATHRMWYPALRDLRMFDDVTFPEPPTLFDDYANRCSGAAKQEMTIANHMWLESDLKVTPVRGDESQSARVWKRDRDRLNAEQLKTWDEYYGPISEAFRKANLSGRDLTRWKYQRYMKDYMSCAATMDENIGRLMDYLDQAGLADDTVVIYSSDQGFYLGEHGWFDKRWMYEESLHMPLIVRWPGEVKPGSVDTHLVSNLDFAETFLEMAGVPVPTDMQGRSLVRLLKGESPADWRKTFYYRYYEYPQPHRVPPHFGVRTERHKLIYYPMTDEWELFDLQKDPQEMRSAYRDAAYAETVKELKAELERLREQYQDTTTDK